jgi:predicted ATPase
MRHRDEDRKLSIHVLGKLRVVRKGKLVLGIDKRRGDELLVYLAVAHRAKRSNAFDTRTIASIIHFDLPQDLNCTFNGLAKALSHIRALLDEPKGGLLGSRGRRSRSRKESVVPRLNLEHVLVDKILFEDLLSGPTPESVLEAVMLYRGHLLQGTDWDWLKDPREKCATELVRALNHPAARHVTNLESRSWARALRRLISLPLLDASSRQQGLSSGAIRSASHSLYRDLLAELTKVRRFRMAHLEFERLVRVSRLCSIGVPDELSRLNANNDLERDQLVRNGWGSILPAYLTKFIARSDDEDRIRDLVRRHRLTTITGAGGIGKTRLAVNVARAVEEDFYNRVAFIGLATIKDASGIVRRIASVLRIPTTDDEPDQLIDSLSGKKMLLILDNCEHVLDLTASIADALLTGCPEISLLATSRSKLGIPGEACFELGGLAYPANGEAVDALLNYSAIRLFISRLQPGSGDRLSAQDMKHIGAICRLMDGMPLPICIAASRAANSGVVQVTEELAQGFELPGIPSQLPKDQTVGSSLDWGYRLLNPSMQTILQRLSCFRGGWDESALWEVCGKPEYEQVQVLSLQEKLRSMSWIDFDGSRFKMLEPIRDYVAKKHARSGGSDRVRDGHFHHFAELARKADAEVMTSKMPVVMRIFLAEEDNFEAALEWSLTRFPERGAELCKSLWKSWISSGYAHNGSQWTEQFLSQTLSEPLRTQLLVILTVLQYYKSDYIEGVRAGKAALAADPAVLDQDLLSILYLTLGSCTYFALQAIKDSLSHLKRAAASAENGASVWVKALCSSNLAYFGARMPGDCGLDVGNLLDLAHQALEFAKATQNPWVLAHVLVNHGILLKGLGHGRTGIYVQERIDTLKDALRIYVSIGDVFGALQALEGLSDIAIENKEYAQAARHFGAQTALENRGRIRLSQHNKDTHQKNVAEAQQLLGSEDFAANFTEGLNGNIESLWTTWE